MATRVAEGNGAALLNSAAEIIRFDSIGPASFNLHNQGSANVVLAASNGTTGATILTDKDTAVAAEASGFVGNGVLVDFSGQALNNTPINPGSVLLTPATSGPDLQDGGDGHFYTVDADADEAGNIDYFTGDMVLSYPVGKEPDGAISADYSYQDELTVGGGKRVFHLANVPADVEVVARCACDESTGSLCKIDGISTWV